MNLTTYFCLPQKNFWFNDVFLCIITVTVARLDNAPLTGEAGHVGFECKVGSATSADAYRESSCGCSRTEVMAHLSKW